MTSGWSLFIILVTLIYIVGCVWLLRWTAKPKAAGEKIGGRTRLIAIGEAKASDRMRTLDDVGRLRRLQGELARRADVSGAMSPATKKGMVK